MALKGAIRDKTGEILMRTIFVITLTLLLGTNTFALEQKSISRVEIDELIAETQKTPPCGDEHMALVWWLPFEFWQASFASDTTSSQHDVQAMLNTLQPYFIIAVVQADISAFGAFTFYPKDAVEQNMTATYIDENGRNIQLESVQTLDPDLEMLIATFKPVLGAAMGNLGENFHFYVYSDISNAGTRKVDPHMKGKLTVRLAQSNGKILKTEIETPLNSLYVLRKCPNGKNAHVSWNYCPWTGKALSM